MSYSDAPPPPPPPPGPGGYGGGTAPAATGTASSQTRQEGDLGPGARHPLPRVLRVVRRHPGDHPRQHGQEEIAASGGLQSGRGMAVAGFVLGIIGVVWTIVALIVEVSTGAFTGSFGG